MEELFDDLWGSNSLRPDRGRDESRPYDKNPAAHDIGGSII
jgi:hypothetical protein